MTAEEKALEKLKTNLCAKWNIQNHKDTRRVRNQLYEIAFNQDALDPYVIMHASTLDELKDIARQMIDAQKDLSELINAATKTID